MIWCLNMFTGTFQPCWFSAKNKDYQNHVFFFMVNFVKNIIFEHVYYNFKPPMRYSLSISRPWWEGSWGRRRLLHVRPLLTTWTTSVSTTVVEWPQSGHVPDGHEMHTFCLLRSETRALCDQIMYSVEFQIYFSDFYKIEISKNNTRFFINKPFLFIY